MDKPQITADIFQLAIDFWNTPSISETNIAGDTRTYTPSQKAAINRKSAGLLCFREGYKAGFEAGLLAASEGKK